MSTKPKTGKIDTPAKPSPSLDPALFPRTAQGRRPYFFDDPNVDKLLAMIMALAGEVSVLRERLDTHERLAAGKSWPSETNVESYDAPDQIVEIREQLRAEFVARVLRVVGADIERMSSAEAEREYQSQVRHVSR